MEGFNTTNTRKAIKPLESNGRSSVAWLGKHYQSVSYNHNFEGLKAYEPANDPKADYVFNIIQDGPNFYQRDSLECTLCKLHIRGATKQTVIPTELTFAGTTCRMIVAYVDTVKSPGDISSNPQYFRDHFASTAYNGVVTSTIESPKHFKVKDDFEVIFDGYWRMPPEQLLAPNATQENCLVDANDFGPKIDVLIDLEGRLFSGVKLGGYPTIGQLVVWFVSDDPNVAALSTYYFKGTIDIYYNCNKD